MQYSVFNKEGELIDILTFYLDSEIKEYLIQNPEYDLIDQSFLEDDDCLDYDEDNEWL